MQQNKTAPVKPSFTLNRRSLLTQLASGVFISTTNISFAEELTRTPAQTEGPFYPDKMPLDTDNDLLVINDNITSAVGTVTHLTGRVLDAKGDPIRSAVVEIWQVDGKGSYLHTKGANSTNGGVKDSNFQGFGRFLTASSGEYYFRTIKPVPYPGRTPHIHVKVKIKGQEAFVTQCYIKGEKRNETDGVLRDIRDAKARKSVIIPFEPVKDSQIGEVKAHFDIVLGFTPSA
ncbi:MAG: protocatechuate 3,4-dioxygenase [Armatimonadetes bacterium]|nr:protocatechuate 3,4-dioxygenase [Armatimonadota bacterium]